MYEERTNFSSLLSHFLLDLIQNINQILLSIFTIIIYCVQCSAMVPFIKFHDCSLNTKRFILLTTLYMIDIHSAFSQNDTWIRYR